MSDSSISGTDKKCLFSGAVINEKIGNPDSPKMCLQIAEHWNEHSIPIVFQQFFALPKSDHVTGYSKFVPELYKNSTENSCLRLATMTVAKAYFSHLAYGLPNDKELLQVYGRALRATNLTLEDPKEREKTVLF